MPKVPSDILDRIKRNDPNLTVVDLSDRRLTGVNIGPLVKALQNNTIVHTLNLSGNRIKKGGIQNLVTLSPRVHTLNLDNNSLGDKDITPFVKNKYIRNLSLNGNNISGKGLRYLLRGDVLHTLHISNNLITGPGGLDILENNTNLRQLYLIGDDFHDFGDDGMPFLAKSRIQTLDISGNSITSDGIEYLRGNNYLVELIYRGGLSHELDAERIKILTELPRLQKLTLTSRIPLEVVPHLKKFHTLIFENSGIGSKGAQILAESKNIRVLGLSRSRVGDDGVRALVQNITLRELNLDNNPISDVGVQLLSETKTLRALSLINIRISDENARRFSLNTSIEELDLRSSPQEITISDTGLKYIVKNPNLRELSLVVGIEPDDIATNTTLIKVTERIQMFTEDTLVSDETARALDRNVKTQSLFELCVQ